MISYRDKTFCPFHEHCAGAATCGRALTPEVRAAAERWWGDVDPPIAVFGDLPQCFEEAEVTDAK